MRYLAFAFCIVGSPIFSLNAFGDSLAEAWVKPLNLPNRQYAIDMALDSDGNIYITGQAFSSPNQGMTVKYDPNGNIAWGPTFHPGMGISIAIDPATRESYMTGRSRNGSNDDIYTAKFNSAGTKQWEVIFNGPGNQRDSGYSVVLDAAGDVYVG